MSEQTTTNALAIDGVIGLATGLGSLRSDLTHYIEDQARELADLRAEQVERIAALETAQADLTARLTELGSVVEKAVTTMQACVAQHERPAAPAKASTASPPKRATQESNKALYVRLLAWAESKGVEAPPKPKGTEFTNAYDKRIQG